MTEEDLPRRLARLLGRLVKLSPEERAPLIAVLSEEERATLDALAEEFKSSASNAKHGSRNSTRPTPRRSAAYLSS